MTLTKITIESSVRFIPITEKTKETLNQKQKKAESLPRKQNKNISQNNKKFLKNNSASGFRMIK